MIRSAVTVSVAALALASCGSPNPDTDGDGTISMEEAAAASEDLVKPDPGQYEVTTEFLDVQAPGAPEQLQQMMRQMLDRGPQTREYCLSEEEAAKGFEEMIREAQDSGTDCSFEKFDADGGDIDAIITCSGEGGGASRVAMQGTGTSTSSEMTLSMDMKAPTGEAMTIKMKNTHRRIGDCDA